MRNDVALYTAVLADLSTEDLVSLVGAEIRRRKCLGVCMISPVTGDGHLLMASVFPDSWADMYTMPAKDQLMRLAAFASIGKECDRHLVRPEEQADGCGDA